MSWNAYTDDHLVGTGKVTHAAIIGLEGEQKGVKWASSPGFELKDDAERNTIANMYHSSPASPPRIPVGGVDHMGIQWDGNTYLGRKGADGCVIKKAGSCAIIAIYKAPIQLQDCLKEVERVAGYLGA